MLGLFRPYAIGSRVVSTLAEDEDASVAFKDYKSLGEFLKLCQL